MTIEKVIDLLDNLVGMITDNQDSDYDDALKMAINALKAQADSDTVSRQAARMCLTGDITDMNIEQYIKMVDKRLEQLPPAHPEQSIAEWQKDFREYINMLNIPRDDCKGIMEYINDVPSAQPQRTGRWIPTDNENFKQCSECGRHVYSYKYPSKAYSYCHCGAKME